MTDDCPKCASPGRVVTVVTVKTLDTDPPTALVTRQCSAAGCCHKYVLFKPAPALSEDERALWHAP